MSRTAEAVALERRLWVSRVDLAREIVDRSERELDHEARARWRDELQSHIERLAVAVGRRAPRLFDDYVRGAKRAELACVGSAPALDAQLRALAEHLRRTRAAPAVPIVDGARRAPIGEKGRPVSSMPATGPYATLAHRYLAAVLARRRREAVELIREAARSGAPLADLYLEVLARVEVEVGRLWEQKLITVADEHYCTGTTQLAIAQLYDEQTISAPRLGPTLMASTAAGEQHELGVRMVSDLLEADGWDAIYFGANVPREASLAAAREQPPDLLALSATLPQGAREIARLIEALRADPHTRAIPVLVGGQAFSADPELYATVGADATAKDAREAVEVARRLVER